MALVSESGQLQSPSRLRLASHPSAQVRSRHRAAVVRAAQKNLVVSGTGTKEGIGRAVTRTFLKAGWKVAGVDVSDPEGEQDDDILQQHQGQYTLLKADLSQADQVARAVSEALDFFGNGHINSLVNNAGIAIPSMPEKKEERKDAFDKFISTNLTGAFLLSEEVIPHLPKGDSSIIHVSSIRALHAEPNTHGYMSAKSGMRGLARCQAVTLDKHARVNTVLPGWIDTPGSSAEITQDKHDWHLVGRAGSNVDIAQAILFFADEERSGFITGQELMVDGGVSSKLVYP